MSHTITKHVCDFCKREYKTEKGITQHEANCYHNPIAHACVTCKHFRPIEEDNPYPHCAIDKDLEAVNENGRGWLSRELQAHCEFWELKQ